MSRHSRSLSMKRLLLCAVILTAMQSVAHRKDELPTYDYEGTIRFVYIHHDSVSSMTYSDGTTVTVHCDFHEGGSDCATGPGSSYFVRFDDKDTATHTNEIACCVKDSLIPQLKDCTDFVNRESLFDCDPLAKLEGALPLGDQKTTLSFRYRPVTLTAFKGDKHPAAGFCVPFEIKDRKGHPKQGEACYHRW
jgi:hypothetical protein